MQLLNASGDLPDPLSFDSRLATVDLRFLGTKAIVPDKPLRSDSYGLTNVYQSIDLFGSGYSRNIESLSKGSSTLICLKISPY
jgi:hypothetical protein